MTLYNAIRVAPHNLSCLHRLDQGVAFMKRVTRNIDPGSARDLLERAPRACLCFACDHGPEAQPIVLVWHGGRYLAGIHEDADRRPGSGQEVVLLIDEGIYFFDLRALYIRGRVKPAEAPRGAPAGCTWFEVVPLKTVAWDYGMLREVRDAS
jgi:hypothetical protein